MSRRLHTPELAAIEVHGMTRSAFILRGALATGALYGAGAVAPFVRNALAQGGAQADMQVLAFAVALEELEANFYATATKGAKLSGAVAKLATEFGKQEVQHRDLLKQTLETLGGKAAAPPKLKASVTDQQTFLKVAVGLEEVGVGAYNGSIPSFTTPDLIAATGSIVQVEGRHAAALRMAAGQAPAPAAFDPALTPAQVQSQLTSSSGG